MSVDEERIDEAVLALLWLTLHDERRAWKGFDWAVLGRLPAKPSSEGYLAAPLRGFGLVASRSLRASLSNRWLCITCC
ncbi:DUF6429 family protein [Methylobacterium sp. P31]